MEELKADLVWQLEKLKKQWLRLYEQLYQKEKEVQYWKSEYQKLEKSKS